jgi:hypothetical protein
MGKEEVNEIGRYTKPTFSAQEKGDYCIEWEKSSMKQADFCKAKGFSRSAFRNWYNDFKEGKSNNSSFSPLYLASQTPIKQDIPQCVIRLPNQIELCMTMNKPTLISFIQELCHATTITR